MTPANVWSVAIELKFDCNAKLANSQILSESAQLKELAAVVRKCSEAIRSFGCPGKDISGGH
jgi:hypothetical protein